MRIISEMECPQLLFLYNDISFMVYFSFFKITKICFITYCLILLTIFFPVPIPTAQKLLVQMWLKKRLSVTSISLATSSFCLLTLPQIEGATTALQKLCWFYHSTWDPHAGWVIFSQFAVETWTLKGTVGYIYFYMKDYLIVIEIKGKCWLLLLMLNSVTAAQRALCYLLRAQWMFQLKWHFWGS